MPPCNIAAYLDLQARQRSQQQAIIVQRGGHGISYAELAKRTEQLAAGFVRDGIARGDRCVIMIPPGIDFFLVAFALFRLGAVLVAVDPGLGLRGLRGCLNQARPAVFIGVARAHWARLLGGWCRHGLRLRIVSGRWGRLAPGCIRLRPGEVPAPLCQNPDTAAILFTSGSTGPPKGVVHSHASLLAQAECLRRHYAIQPGEVDLATFPLFGLFGPVLGLTVVIPDMKASHPGRARPRRILAALREHGVTTMFASPALLRRVVNHAQRHEATRLPGASPALPGLRRVFAAGAPISAELLGDFSRLLGARVPVHTPYGATEALPLASISQLERASLDEATRRGRGICVGKPLAGTEVHIVPVSDQAIAHWSNSLPLSTGEIGEIVARGPQVSERYFKDDRHNELAKIACADGGCYHRMGDLGYFDALGRLWYCGRKSQRVMLNGEVLHTINCEGVFNACPLVEQSALVAVAGASGTLPVLCVQLRPWARRQSRKRLFAELRERAASEPHTRVIQHFLVHPCLPTDARHNAKIRREVLAVWASQRLAKSGTLHQPTG